MPASEPPNPPAPSSFVQAGLPSDPVCVTLSWPGGNSAGALSGHAAPLQISLDINSQEQSLEFRARGLDGDLVSSTFPAPQLFDLRWHKLMLSVADRVASVHLDCTSASTQLLGPRRPVQPGGHVFLGLDAEQGKPVSVSALRGDCFLGAG